MRYQPFKDVGYHHHWKLMALVAAALLVAMVLAFAEGWFLVAVVIAIFLATIVVQWITIDPPDVTDEDVHGKLR